MVEVIVIVLVFGHLFAIILGFAEQSFSIVWLSVRLDVRSRLASPSRRSQLLIHLAFGGLIVLGLSFGLSLDRLFATLFVRDFGPSRNRSQLFSASPSSRLSGLPSNCARLCVTVFNYRLLKLQAVQDEIYLQIDCTLASDHPPGSRWII